MGTRSIAKLVLAVMALSAISLAASVLTTGSHSGQLPRFWLFVGEGIFISSAVWALVWSTGLARKWQRGWLPTGLLGVGFGSFVLLATAVLANALYQPMWEVLPFSFVGMDGIAFRPDAVWLLNKVIFCLVLSLPFAGWRAFQNRHRKSGELSSATCAI
jgi:hypothetical protein